MRSCINLAAMAGLVLGLLFGSLPGALSPARAMVTDSTSESDPAALNPATARNLRLALQAADRHSWKMFHRYQSRIKHPLAAKTVLWRGIVKGDPMLDFVAVNRFLKDNPEWPSRNTILRRAEELLDEKTTSPADIVAWFGDRQPRSAAGRGMLGRALIATGQVAEGVAIIRTAWIEGNFNRKQEKAFLSRNRKHLRKADHLSRLDRLLWDGKYWPSRRLIPRVDKDQRLLGEARLILRRDLGNPDRAVARVPTHLRDHPGLIYERLRWRRRKNLDSAAELLKDLPAGVPHAEKWWAERATLSRRLLRKGHVSEAYRIVADHGLVKSQAEDFAEAEWTAGWIAFRFLNELDDARRHFAAMHDAVRYPVSVSRGAYWLGRVAEAAGNVDAQKSWYTAAAHHARSYYGQLAAARLNPGASLPIGQEPEPTADERLAFAQHEMVMVVRMLGDNDAADYIRPFVSALSTANHTPEWKSLVARLARQSGRPDLSVRVAKRAARSGIDLPESGYPSLTPPPTPKRLKSPRPEIPFVLAVIRQESAFWVKARSHANAQGLMQIIPPTAERVAKAMGMSYSRRRLTSDPDYNMTLGQAYLSTVLAEFDGSYLLALSAYNAGPARARRWIKENGDPRSKEVDAIDWIEMIPFDETRNYVQRVLENLQVYRSRLADTEVALALENDLHQ